MKKVLTWVLILGVLGLAIGVPLGQIQPTPALVADDPKIGGGGG